MLLKFFRKRLKAILWITIVGTVPPFIFLYGYSRSRGASTYILAKVNREPIYIEDFYKEVDKIKKNYPFIKDSKKIRNIAYQKLLGKIVLSQETRKNRIRVTNDEVIQFLRSLPYFKDKNGKFHPEYIKNLPDEELRYLESIAKESILAGKMRALVTSGIRVSDEEVKKRFSEERTKYTLLILEKGTKNLEITSNPSEEELKEFLNKNKDMFRIGPLYKIAWIEIKDKEFYPLIKITQEEIKKYYNKNSDEFKISDTQIIPLKEVKGKIEEKLKKEKARKKAKDTSFDLSLKLIDVDNWEKALGGRRKVKRTGWINGKKLYSLLNILPTQIGNLPTGESSEPIRVKDGYIVLKLVEKKPRYLPVWEKIKENVKKAWIEKEKFNEAGRILEKARKKILEGEDISAFIKNYKIEEEEKGPFIFSGYLQGLGYFPELRKELLKSKVSSVHKIGDRVFLVKVVKKEEPEMKELTPQVEKALREKMLQEKKQEFFSRWLEEKKKEANIVFFRKDLLD